MMYKQKPCISREFKNAPPEIAQTFNRKKIKMDKVNHGLFLVT